MIATKTGAVRVASIYAPNGNPVDTEKYPYKLKWHDRLIAHTEKLVARTKSCSCSAATTTSSRPPTTCTIRKPGSTTRCSNSKSRRKLRQLVNLGLTDAFRACNAAPHQYTFWDYQAGAWQKNNGIRIDHLLLSPQAADRLKTCAIDKHVRAWEKPSDHVPIWCELALMTTKTLEGGCLCGAIRYRLGGEIEDSAYCHCRTCQRQSGAPVVAWFSIAPARSPTRKANRKGYRASTRATREFCGDCGTYLLFREDDANRNARRQHRNARRPRASAADVPHLARKPRSVVRHGRQIPAPRQGQNMIIYPLAYLVAKARMIASLLPR